MVLPEETFNYLHIASSVGKGVQFPLMMGIGDLIDSGMSSIPDNLMFLAVYFFFGLAAE